MANTANIALTVPVIEATVTLSTPAPTVSIAVTTGGARGPQGPAGEESGTALQPDDVVRLGSIPQIIPETHIADHVDRRILGLTANASTMDIFSTLNNSGSGTYVRNASNWAADIDWTCIAAYNSAAASGVNGGGPTVISPLHGIAANHYTSSYTIGATVRYVTADNAVVSRTIASVQQVGSTDIQIVKFSSALPDTITAAKVLPANYADIFDIVGLPAVRTDKDQNLLVADLDTAYSFAAPSDAQRLTFYEAAVSGDSGSPVFVIIDGDPVMLFGFAGGGGVANGEELAAQITGINSAMTTLGGGYQLTPVQLPASSPTIPWASITDAPSVGLGDVVGPASATANAVPLFNGTTGKLLKNGVLTSTGGNGAGDGGKIPVFHGGGGLSVTDLGLTILASAAARYAELNPSAFRFYNDDYDTLDLEFNAANQTIAFPSTTGTLALTTTNFPASQITSGTLAHERGGLEADVSAYSGLLKIAGGTTSSVSTSAGGNGAGDSGKVPVFDSNGFLTAGRLTATDGTGFSQLTETQIAFDNGTSDCVLNAAFNDQVLSLPTSSGTLALTTTNFPASQITSGTLAHERGGLEADVSAYSGLLKIDGGATSAVATSSGGNGAADSGKVPVFSGSGHLWMREGIHIFGDDEVQIQPGGDLAYIDNGVGGKSCVIELGANPQNQTFTLPNESGILVTTIHAQTLEDKTISGSANTITNLNASNLSSGTVAVARGGTGATTLAANNVLLGNGTSAVQVVAPGTSGNVLTSNGTTWQSTTPAAGSGPTIVYSVADQDITATSLADVTSLSYALASNEQVEFTARLRVVASVSSEAPRPAINGPSGLVYLTASAQWAYAITTTQEEPIIAYETAAAFTQSSTSERLLTVSGTLINGATSGTLQIRCATETASGGAKVTLKAGSSLTVHSE